MLSTFGVSAFLFGTTLVGASVWRGRRLGRARVDYDVVVIGAGVSGIHAASVLHKSGAKYQVVEASGKFGGRVRSLEPGEFSDSSIELGAEEIHGEPEALAPYIGAIKPIQHQSKNDAIRVDKKLMWLDEARAVPDVRPALEFIETVGQYDGPNETVADHLARVNFPQKGIHYLRSRVGVENGTTIDRVWMGSIGGQSSAWSFREYNRTLPVSYSSLFAPAVDLIRSNTRLNSVVAKVSVGDSGVVVTLRDGTTLRCRTVVLTVPIPVLRDGDIEFVPPLPERKMNAVRALKMDAGMKIILKFKRRFWDDRLYFLHTDGFFPQYWATGKSKSAENRVLTVFLGGAKAEQLRAEGGNFAAKALAELDDVFGNKVATKEFEDSYLMDWTAEPYIRGLYTYPSKDELVHRKILAEPVGKRLFFAGEAAHYEGDASTVHGAIEAGERAAMEAMAVARS